MQRIELKLTVLFEEPFWIAVCERCAGNKMQACKIVFGSEPKDYEVYEYILHHLYSLSFGPFVNIGDAPPAVKINPKRMRRRVKAQLAKDGIGTKAQRALKMQRDEAKTTRKTISKQQKTEERQQKYLARKVKRKEKHRGH